MAGCCTSVMLGGWILLNLERWTLSLEFLFWLPLFSLATAKVLYFGCRRVVGEEVADDVDCEVARPVAAATSEAAIMRGCCKRFGHERVTFLGLQQLSLAEGGLIVFRYGHKSQHVGTTKNGIRKLAIQDQAEISSKEGVVLKASKPHASTKNRA